MISRYLSFINYIRCELNLSAHTVLAYSGDLKQWEKFCRSQFGEQYDPAEATTNDLRIWIANLARNGVTQRTIRRKIQTLRSFFDYLMKRHGYLSNPAAELQPARLPKPLPRTIPPADTARVIDTPADPADPSAVRDRLIVDMLYSTGMRASELATLLDNNVNSISGELKVLGKRNKERVIPFGDELREMIDLYRTLRPTGDNKSFFRLDDGRPLAYRHVNAIVKKEFAGSTSLPTPHCLRHSCATDLLNNGADLTAVKELLGHASLATTQIYTHLSYSELKHNYELAHPRAQKKR
ncbi:MAG: tyrosine-type recombinase/integrase [Odoribacter sp.]|nr:tyrosine-type recombinase/integrase [Odoribacter sp.]